MKVTMSVESKIECDVYEIAKTIAHSPELFADLWLSFCNCCNHENIDMTEFGKLMAEGMDLIDLKH